MNEEIEINLKDLLIYWLLHFRSMIVVSLIAFVVVGGLKTYNVMESEDFVKTKTQSQEDDTYGKDSQVVATYSLILTDTPTFDESISNVRYITIDGTDETTAKNIANAIMSNVEKNNEENVIYEISILGEEQEQEKVYPSVVFIKYGLGAAIVFLCLHATCWSMRYILTGRIRTKSQQKSMFNICQLGGLRDGEINLYKRHSKIDIWLRTVGGYEEFSEDECLKMVVINLKLLLNKAKQESEKINVLITGQASNTFKEKVSAEISREFYNVKCNMVEDVIHKVSDMEKLMDADYLVFVEKYGITRYKKMHEEISYSLHSGVEIAGCVWE